ncbi:uncharacterized protein ARMOST_18078 [Armillaria ostoyae]|uniref:Uncharacterized protein n=1 Tax=Armillaria ostoyae TaxID=47428 RepID=A0A284S0T4_ARMOS|nr:uncharacterized protein ARMOST_18078 [Armillaria ostoyae]
MPAIADQPDGSDDKGGVAGGLLKYEGSRRRNFDSKSKEGILSFHRLLLYETVSRSAPLDFTPPSPPSVYMKLPVYSNSHQDQAESMTSPNLLARETPAAHAATASGRTPDRTIVEIQQVRVAKRHQAAVQGLIDSAWREASMRLLPSELAKTQSDAKRDRYSLELIPGRHGNKEKMKYVVLW